MRHSLKRHCSVEQDDFVKVLLFSRVRCELDGRMWFGIARTEWSQAVNIGQVWSFGCLWLEAWSRCTEMPTRPVARLQPSEHAR